MTNSAADIILQKADNRLALSGEWIIDNISVLAKQGIALLMQCPSPLLVDAQAITRLDSAGAWQLYKLTELLQQRGVTCSIEGLNATDRHLFDLVVERGKIINKPVAQELTRPWLVTVGRWAVAKYHQAAGFFAFVGEVVILWLWQIRHLYRYPWRATLKVVEETGCEALPIVALMIFLIGVVLAYQLATQLRTYGADSYIAGLTGIAILREFSPMITAIIIAGRTSTAFTALIGTMKVNEELDALNTMGISPIESLVLPRLTGLLVALPLLVVWGNLFGILGSMVMTKVILGIGYDAFLELFSTDVSLTQYVLGLVKTPVFALLIAGVGCFQGFQVAGSADSVGQKTTQAAVQAIFLIIIADALFSVLFSWQGL